MIVSTFTDNHFLIYVLKRGCSKKILHSQKIILFKNWKKILKQNLDNIKM